MTDSGGDRGSADFSGRMLDHADFSGQTLVGADFSGASLIDANFDGAILDGANFRGAQLGTGSYWPSGNATFVGASLRGAVLDGTDLGYVDFTDADLTDASAVDAEWDVPILGGATLTRIRLNEGELERLIYARDTLKHLDELRVELRGLDESKGRESDEALGVLETLANGWMSSSLYEGYEHAEGLFGELSDRYYSRFGPDDQRTVAATLNWVVASLSFGALDLEQLRLKLDAVVAWSCDHPGHLDSYQLLKYVTWLVDVHISQYEDRYSEEDEDIGMTPPAPELLALLEQAAEHAKSTPDQAGEMPERAEAIDGLVVEASAALARYT